MRSRAGVRRGRAERPSSTIQSTGVKRHYHDSGHPMNGLLRPLRRDELIRLHENRGGNMQGIERVETVRRSDILGIRDDTLK